MTPGVGGSAATPTDNSTTPLHEPAEQRRASSMSASSNPQGISRDIANPETTQKSRSKANETFNVFNAMKANLEKNRNIQIMKKLMAPVFVIISVFKQIYPFATSNLKKAFHSSNDGVSLTSEEKKLKKFIDNPKSMKPDDAKNLGEYLSRSKESPLLDHLSNLGNNEATRESFITFAEAMGIHLTPATCSDLMEKLSDKAGFEIAKQLVKNELTLPETSKATLFRSNTIAARMITAYQTQVMIKETGSELKGIFDRLPTQRYLLREVDHPDQDKEKAAEIIQENQKRLMNDFSMIMKEVDSFTKNEKFPSRIKELNQFIETEVNERFPGEGAKFAPQFFFLRFFNSAISQGAGFNKALPEKSPEQVRVGIQLTKLIQNVVNEMKTTKEEHMQFFFDAVNQENNPEVALFKGISERLRTP